MDPANQIEKIKDEYRTRRGTKEAEKLSKLSGDPTSDEFPLGACVGSLYATGAGLFVCYGKIDGETLWRKVDDRLPGNQGNA